MTEISRDDVMHMAALSGIDLDEAETTDLQADLTNIVSHIDMLGELDTAGVEATYQVTDRENIFREDTIDSDTVSGDQLVDLAAEHQDNQIKVPKVL